MMGTLAAVNSPDYPSRKSQRGGITVSFRDPFGEYSAQAKKKTTLLVRWLAIIATSYLLVLNRGGHLGLAIASLIFFYIASNFLLLAVPADFFLRKKFDSLIVIVDTLVVSLAIYLSGAQQTDLYLAYFLILIFSAVGRNLKTVVLGAVVMSFFYGWTVFSSQTDGFFLQAGLLFRIPFLFLIAAFYGYFVEENTVLHHRARVSAEELRMANRELQFMSWNTLRTLLNALDLRDINTAGHSNRVRHFTLTLASEMGMKGEPLVAIERAAFLHDIGKIGIPDAILQKPGPLTPAEWEVMKQHPVLGYQMLKDAGFLAATARIVLHHHERYDGTGYPSGLRGKEIPLGARIFAVVDAFDAITSPRPYKRGTSYEKAIEELKGNAGTQFDPQVVETFVKIPHAVWDGLKQAS